MKKIVILLAVALMGFSTATMAKKKTLKVSTELKGAETKKLSFEVDKDGYTIAGKPLGDHYPLIVNFSVATPEKTTAISTVNNATPADDEWYSLQGVRKDANAKGISISRSGKKMIQK